MHDIDGTRLESNDYGEAEGYQELGDELGETGEFGEMDEMGEFDEMGEAEAEDSFEASMTEAEEEELAAELLGVSTEEELDHFLGGLFRKIRQGVSGAARFLSQSGFPLSTALKSLAQRALPFVGGAIGTAIPIPGLGTLAGSALGKAASSLLQSEMDQFEGEDQEFQMAKRFVRLASQAVRQGARIPPRFHPTTTANLALRNALRRYRQVGGIGYRGGYRPGHRTGYRGYRHGYRPGYGTGFRQGYRRHWPRYRSGGYGAGAGYDPYTAANPPCPPPEPCPPCPTCAQPLPDASQEPVGGTGGGPDAGGVGGNPPNANTGTQGTGAQGAELNEEIIEEFGSPEQEYGEGEGEGEFYETDEYGASHAPIPSGGRSGRWVRRGRKIILYGH